MKSMICIFSNSTDTSTTDVMRWLYHFGRHDVIRINHNDTNSNKTRQLIIEEGTFSFQLDDQLIHVSDIEAVWYRKGKNWLCDQFYPVSVKDYSRFTAYLNAKVSAEEAALSQYVHYIIERRVPTLGSSTKGLPNKLMVLAAAKETGFLIPAFYISNSKEKIKQILQQFPDLITKSISDGIYLFENMESETSFISYTEKITDELTEHLPWQIAPSLLQKNIIKKYELRVFFLENKCYSMAIFSQTDAQTTIDFRKYNNKKPNRVVPYMLPVEIDRKIKELFKKLELNTGSLDLLVDKDENFFFLEINPVGQFIMVSEPCNYFIEQQIALTLINHATRTN